MAQEIPTVSGYIHSILRFGYVLAEIQIENNIEAYGFPQEDYIPSTEEKKATGNIA